MLDKVGHALPMSADDAPQPEAKVAGGDTPAKQKPRAAGKAPQGKTKGAVDGAEDVSASLEAYLARKAARSTPSARSAKKGSDKGRRAAASSAREPLSDDDLDRLGTRLREER